MDEIEGSTDSTAVLRPTLVNIVVRVSRMSARVVCRRVSAVAPNVVTIVGSFWCGLTVGFVPLLLQVLLCEKSASDRIQPITWGQTSARLHCDIAVGLNAHIWTMRSSISYRFSKYFKANQSNDKHLRHQSKIIASTESWHVKQGTCAGSTTVPSIATSLILLDFTRSHVLLSYSLK